MPGTEPDGWTDGQPELLVGSAAGGLSPLEGLAVPRGSGGPQTTQDAAHFQPPSLCPGVTILAGWLTAARCAGLGQGTPRHIPPTWQL